MSIHVYVKRLRINILELPNLGSPASTRLFQSKDTVRGDLSTDTHEFSMDVVITVSETFSTLLITAHFCLFVSVLHVTSTLPG